MVRPSLLWIAGFAVALVFSGACGKRPATKPPPESTADCRISPVSPAAGGPVTFALLQPVDLGRAPWASEASERILFGHLYETLVVVDCAGEVRPCVAGSWASAEGDRVWTFELRKDARFWDRTPVTARDVATSWRDPLTLDTIIDSVSVRSDRRLTVHLKRPDRHFPRVVSSPLWAVTKPSGDSPWLMGTGPFRIGSVDVNAYPTARRTISVYPAFGGSGPVIRFVETSVDRVRDGLENAIDVVVTADPATIEYAAARPQFSTVPLPWDRTYVLLSPSRVQGLGAGRAASAIPPEVLDGLARDAVRGEARGYRAPSWWDELSDCDPPRRSVGDAGGSVSAKTRRVVYDADDVVARALSERIAALSAADTARSAEARAFARAVPGLSNPALETVATGMGRDEFQRSLRRGDEFAYVIGLPGEAPDPCGEARALAGSAPWLSRAKRDLAEVLIPLVDTRPHLIVRKDTVGLRLGGNGSVHVLPGEEQPEKAKGDSR